MEASQIRDLVEDAIEEELQTGRVAQLVRDLAARDSRSSSPEHVASTVAFVKDYVRNVPHLMEHAAEAARGTLAEAKLFRVMTAAIAYWEEENDIVPDDLGLIGVMDDAYCSLKMLQEISERFAADTGAPLMAEDLHAANQAIRRLLGPEVGQRLDDYVYSALGDTALVDLIGGLATDQTPPPAPVRTVWGEQPPDDVIGALLELE
jgi:uncharacterized membrane protein YkvA (DUF1232 family)